MSRQQTGFTIIELLIATLVFSSVLVLVTTGVIHFSKQYYKGQIVNNTQNVTRAAVNQIAQAIQFGGGGVAPIGSPGNGIGGFCINSHPYYYALGRQIGGTMGNSTADALVSSPTANCGSSPVDITGGTSGITDAHELLGKNMRLAYFDVSPDPNPSIDLVTVHMRVVYGDPDLLCYKHAGSCQPATSLANGLMDSSLQCAAGAGNEYCAVSDYSVTVSKRL